MTDFKRSVEQAIGEFKYGDERWLDVFQRLDKEGGMDMKKVTLVLVSILEELDARKEEIDTPREGLPEAQSSVPEGSGSVEEEA